jgi:hypothetical protein
MVEGQMRQPLAVYRNLSLDKLTVLIKYLCLQNAFFFLNSSIFRFSLKNENFMLCGESAQRRKARKSIIGLVDTLTLHISAPGPIQAW